VYLFRLREKLDQAIRLKDDCFDNEDFALADEYRNQIKTLEFQIQMMAQTGRNDLYAHLLGVWSHSLVQFLRQLYRTVRSALQLQTWDPRGILMLDKHVKLKQTLRIIPAGNTDVIAKSLLNICPSLVSPLSRGSEAILNQIQGLTEKNVEFQTHSVNLDY
jgi:hypothetical protein